MDEKIILESVEEKLILTKVNIVGEKFFHVFTDLKGKEVEFETTETDYRQLGTSTPSNPKQKDLIWKYSYTRNKFDTINGDLNDKEYYDDNLEYTLRLSGKNIQIQKNEIINNEIETSIVVNTINKII